MVSTQPSFFSKQVSQARRFYLDLNPSAEDPLSVVCGGAEICLPDYRVDRDDFPYFSLEFVTRGKGTVSFENEEQISSGVAYTYGPGMTHKIASDSDEPLEKYFVDFVGKEVPALLEEVDLRPGSVRRVQSSIELQRCLEELLLHGSRSSGTSSRLCDTLMHYILVLVSATAVSSAHGNTTAFSTYLRCKEHIEQNYMKLHTLDDTAIEMDIDKAYLCRLFQRFDSHTAYMYLTRLKMNKAAELLEEPRMLIRQVAAAVGFSDAFHFSRIFRKIFGMSPKEFRQRRFYR